MSAVTAIAVATDVLDVIGDRIRPVVEGNQAGGTMEVFDVEGDQGSGPPPHAHPWLETFYVIDGRLTLEMGGTQHALEAGTSAVVPAGEVHTFRVESPTARFITVTTGAEASKFFRDLSSNVPGTPTPESLPAIIEVAKRHGLSSPLF
jgi:quercetin dioxygenase-like cupin family protein